jgi:hypothetical protein
VCFIEFKIGCAPPAGELCLQAKVRVRDNPGRFDDIVGRGWMLLSLEEEWGLFVSPRHIEFLRRIGARCAYIGSNVKSEVIDVDGKYLEFFQAFAVTTMIVRPDFYIFGAVSVASDLPTVIDDLMRQLPVAA